MMFLTILINGTVQERTILLHKTQTDLKLDHKAVKQIVQKSTGDGNKTDNPVMFCFPFHGFVGCRQWFLKFLNIWSRVLI